MVTNGSSYLVPLSVLHSYIHTDLVRLIPEVSIPCDPSLSSHSSMLNSNNHTTKIEYFPFSFQIRVLHFLLLDGTIVKNILSLLILLTSSQSTPPKTSKTTKKWKWFCRLCNKIFMYNVYMQLLIRDFVFPVRYV